MAAAASGLTPYQQVGKWHGPLIDPIQNHPRIAAAVVGSLFAIGVVAAVVAGLHFGGVVNFKAVASFVATKASIAGHEIAKAAAVVAKFLAAPATVGKLTMPMGAYMGAGVGVAGVLGLGAAGAVHHRRQAAASAAAAVGGGNDQVDDADGALATNSY